MCRSVPPQLKTAIGVGSGLVLMIIGRVDAGFVRRVPDAAGTTVPVGLGIGGKLVTWPSLVFVLGLLFTLILMIIPGSQILIYPVLWILMPTERIAGAPAQITHPPTI